MKAFSASEAIWPALERTYAYLFRPFKAEAFLKLATAATLSEGFLVSFRFTIPNTSPFDIDTAALKTFLLAPEFLPVTILGAMAIFLAAVYCYSRVLRLRFAFFHTLIHQTREFRAAVRLYTVESDRFFTACMLIWLSFLVLVSLAIALFAVAAYAVLASPTPEGKLDLGNFLILFFPCIGIVFILILALYAAQVVLSDFILPHMAIESASFPRSWAAVRARMAANRETFFSYFILRLFVPLAAGIALAAAAWLLGFIVFGVLELSAAGFNAMLDGTTDARATVLIAVHLLFVVLGMGAGALIAVSFAGPIGVFTRSYALYFYGGHYPALGNLLSPPTPQPAPLLKKAVTIRN